MAKIRGVVFDMDGVLIDAKEWHYEALNRALEIFGYKISRSQHVMAFDGLPTSRKLAMLSKEQGLPTALHPFLNELKQIYTMEIIHSRCRPIFQHEYALARLKAQGYKIAVASNSIRATVEMMMKKSNLSQYFDLMLSNQDVSQAKPDPEIYHKAIAGLSLSPQEVIVVEDNENGVTAARLAGAHLMVVNDVKNVTFDNIMRHIKAIDTN